MKKLICILVLLQGSISWSQEYNPLVDSLNKWSGMSCAIDPNYTLGPFDCETSFVRFSQDTVIEGNTYLKVYKSDTLQQNWVLQGYIRENSLREVYFRNLIDQEKLLYDFGLEINDSVVLGGGWPDTLICTDIDSVLIGNDYRKRIHLKNDGFPIDTWIEGIGSEYGVLKSGQYLIGATNDLLCYYEHDSLLYISPYNDCFISGILGPFFITENLDTAYLNQYYEYQLEITGNPSNAILFQDYVLPLGLSLDSQTGLISGVPDQIGNYTVAFILQNYIHPTDILSTTVNVVDPVGIDDNSKTDKISIHPNPASDEFLISGLPFQINKPKLLRIYNLQGEIREEIVIPNKAENISIDSKGWKSGFYLVRLDINDKLYYSKLIIQ